MRAMRVAVLLAVWCATLIAGARGVRAADEPDFLVLGVGAYDVLDDFIATEFDAQFRFNERLWFIRPMVGAMATTDSAFFAYAGIFADINLGQRLVVTPSFGAGIYHEGDGKDLGGNLQFRSAVEFAYRFDDRARLGVELGHLSNGSILDTNPGEEFIIVNYSLPTDVFTR